jgi:hypothetical protein
MVFAEPEDKGHLNEELTRWINTERFTALPKIGGIGLNDMSDIGKMLVIFVMTEQDSGNPDQARYVVLFRAVLLQQEPCRIMGHIL